MIKFSFVIDRHTKVMPRAHQSIVIHIVACWMLFSCLYLVASYYKPFHVDEFYSWVYAERTSLKEIIKFKDFGIGHPPLFHIAQKVVNQLFPVHHPMLVRITNYIIGSAFVALFASFLAKFKVSPSIFYGIASSAGVLNIFVFSRMWGLVCLASLGLLWAGERFAANRSYLNAGLILAVCIVGFLSDYSFVLLMPYVFFVFITGKNNKTRITTLVFCIIVVICLLTLFIRVYMGGLSYTNAIYFLPQSGLRIVFEAGNLILNFWFLEPFLLAWIVVSIVCCISSRLFSKNDIGKLQNQTWAFVIIIVCIIVLEALVRTDILRVRYASLLASILLATYLFLRKKRGTMFDGQTERCVQGVTAAICLLLIFTQFSWRDLREVRFLTVLLPYLFFLICINFNRKSVAFISFVLIFSGVLYIFSSGVSDYFPPPTFESRRYIVYQNEFAYSSQYLKNQPQEGDPLYFLELKYFKRFCRVCEMGTDNIPFNRFHKFWAVGREDFLLQKSEIPSTFVLKGRKEVGLTSLDKFQFLHFTPIYSRRFFIYEYIRNKDLTS